MSVDNAIFIYLLISLVINFDFTSSECTTIGHCACVFPNGMGYNFTKLSSDKPIVSENSNLYPNKKFFFQPCGNAVIRDNDTKDDTCSKGKGVSLCLNSTNTGKLVNLGTFEETLMKFESTINPIVAFVINHNNTVSRINLICDPYSRQASLRIDEIKDSGNFLQLVSADTCKIQIHSGGLSTGSILVMLLFLFSGVYLIGGALTLKFLKGATGWEMLPNQAFWADLPMLVRDGIAFTFSGCKAESYDRI